MHKFYPLVTLTHFTIPEGELEAVIMQANNKITNHHYPRPPPYAKLIPTQHIGHPKIEIHSILM
jgi:hypothetical protein